MLLSRVIYTEVTIDDIVSLKHPVISHVYFCLFLQCRQHVKKKKLISRPNFKKQKKALKL